MKPPWCGVSPYSSWLVLLDVSHEIYKPKWTKKEMRQPNSRFEFRAFVTDTETCWCSSTINHFSELYEEECISAGEFWFLMVDFNQELKVYQIFLLVLTNFSAIRKSDTLLCYSYCFSQFFLADTLLADVTWLWIEFPSWGWRRQTEARVACLEMISWKGRLNLIFLFCWTQYCEAVL